jgi:hypothetical protein
MTLCQSCRYGKTLHCTCPEQRSIAHFIKHDSLKTFKGCVYYEKYKESQTTSVAIVAEQAPDPNRVSCGLPTRHNEFRMKE